MAVAVVQTAPSTEAVGVTSLAVTFGSPTTAGNRVVACSAIFDTDGVAPTGVTAADSQTNTYSSAREQAFGGDAGNDGTILAQNYSAAIVGGAAHQVTVTPGDTVNMTVGILELSGVDVANPLTGTATGGRNSSTTPSAGPMTPAQNGLFIAQMGYDSGPKTITPNWTGATEFKIDENNDAQDQSILYKAATAAAADTAAWTLNALAQWGAQIVAYREAATDTLMSQIVM